MTTTAAVELFDSAGRRAGSMSVSTVSAASSRGVVDSGLGGRDVAQVSVFEDGEYRYELELDESFGGAELAAIEPAELFSPNPRGRTGRFRPKRRVGTVEVRLRGREEVLTGLIEVCAVKLRAETEYRYMLQRIAEEAAELVQQSFAANASAFNPSTDGGSTETLYQRFAFLQSFVESDRFQDALGQLRQAPHSEHRASTEFQNPARVSGGPSRMVRQLVGPGRRVAIATPLAGLTSLPERIERVTAVHSFDTEPNRFLRFVFEQWRNLCASISESLGDSSAADRRGAREARLLEARLSQLLQIPAVAQAGRLDRFPAGNTVLGARAGYREVFRAFLLFEAASALTWEGGDDVFRAGQRDIAALYEYWVFLELVRTTRNIEGFVFEAESLVKRSAAGLQLSLKRDGSTVLRGHGARGGRRVELELWFNRTFAAANSDHDAAVANRHDGSWTVSMKPDCSIKISPEGGLPTWVHFDAKYRIDGVVQLLDADPDADRSASSKTDDLRKMHAYRDAIRRTAGAYVVYPGDEPLSYGQFHEILPGLGAFPLRPESGGQASESGEAAVRGFLEDVIDHVASQATAHARTEYWAQRSYLEEPPTRTVGYSELLTKPPADTKVLVGFIKGPAHLRWVQEQGCYNLRADADRNGSVDVQSPELSTDFVLLYDADSQDVWAWRSSKALYLRSRDDLLDSDYPEPRGESYLCIGLAEPVEVPIDGTTLRELTDRSARPRTMTWLSVFGEGNPIAG